MFIIFKFTQSVILIIGIVCTMTVSVSGQNSPMTLFQLTRSSTPHYNDGILRQFTGVGDQNGDGYMDLLVGDWTRNEAYLYYGGAPMDTLPDHIFTSLYPDSITIGTVRRVGDLNGDGIVDFQVEGMEMWPENSWAQVYYGGDPPTLAGIFRHLDSDWETWYPVGDLNADGYDDLAARFVRYGGPGNYRGGMIRIYYGGTSLDTVPDAEIGFDSTYQVVGYNLWRVNREKPERDLNGDGIADLLVNAWYQPTETARNFIYWGSADFDTTLDAFYTYSTPFPFAVSKYPQQIGDVFGTGQSAVALWDVSDTTLYVWPALSTTNSAPSAWVIDPNQTGGGFFSPRYIGDVNGDGYDDVLIADPAGVGGTGQVLLYCTGPDFDEIVDWRVTGWANGLWDLGTHASWVGDVNGDGCADLAFSAHTSSIAGEGQTLLIVLAGDTAWTTNHIPRIVNWSPRDTIVQAVPGDTLHFAVRVVDRDSLSQRRIRYEWRTNRQYLLDPNYQYGTRDTFTTVIDSAVTVDQCSLFVKVWDWTVSRYHHWVIQVDTAAVDISDAEAIVPETFRVFPAYPNPFNTQTTLDYTLPQSGVVEITVYDLRGRQIYRFTTHNKPPGRYQFRWDGTNQAGESVSSGIYLVRTVFEPGRHRAKFIKKVVLIK